MTGGLLSGVRVLESSAFIAAPLCGVTLAQHGAEVIRVDLIGGGIDYGRLPLQPGGRSIYWTSLNKGKKSIAIDIRRSEGKELVRALVIAPGPDGGILLTNVPAPWLAHAALQTARPDLISCTIEGNADGSTALDYTVNCATGYPLLTGDASRERPVNHVLPAWDVACAYQAAFGLTAAVVKRRTTGEGAELRLALSDVAFATMSHLGLMTEASLGLPERTPLGNHIYGAFGHDFATRDGRRIMVAAVSLRQWQALVQVTGLGADVATHERAHGVDLRQEADRFAHRDAIVALLAPWMAARSLEDVAAIFDKAGVCWGRYQSAGELVRDDPRISAAGSIYRDIETEGVGRHLAAGAMIRRVGADATAPEAAPLLGQDTDHVLGDVLGLSAAAIGRLHDQGVVAGPDRDPLFPRAAALPPRAAAAAGAA
jgi:2-methylfumaryl-CoA isomerase